MFTMIYADEESVLLFSWQKGARLVEGIGLTVCVNAITGQTGMTG